MKGIQKTTDPFVYMCIASGNPDAVVLICWIQAQVQNGCLLTTEKGAFLRLDFCHKNTTILASRVEPCEVLINS